MRYNFHKAPPVDSLIRAREGFLWLPKIIAGELRWLERARWMEQYTRFWGCSSPEWVGIRWLD